MSEQRSAHTAATQKAASDQEAQHAALPALPLVLAGVLVFVLVFVLAPLAHQMGEERATNAAPAKHAAGDQKTQDLAMIFLLALVLTLVDVLTLVLVFRLVALAQEMRKKQAADALAAQQAARNQQLEQAMFFIAPLLAFLAAIFVTLLIAAAFAQQTCQQRAPHASATYHAASN
jgi:hypothetical protein